MTGLWTDILNKKVLAKKCKCVRTSQGRPLCGRAVYIRCLQEIGLSNLTPPVFQGTAVSSEHICQYPRRKIEDLGGFLPPMRSPEQLYWPSPAGPPLQGTKLATLSTPEVSLERLIPLVDYLAVLKLLPNVSQWVLHIVERGYKIQFSTCPPRFNRVFPTLLGPEQALVKEQEVDFLS